jgi:hypothetical protein
MSELIKCTENISFREVKADEPVPETRQVYLTKEKQEWAKSMIMSALQKPKLEVLEWDDVESWLGKVQ